MHARFSGQSWSLKHFGVHAGGDPKYPARQWQIARFRLTMHEAIVPQGDGLHGFTCRRLTKLYGPGCPSVAFACSAELKHLFLKRVNKITTLSMVASIYWCSGRDLRPSYQGCPTFGHQQVARCFFASHLAWRAQTCLHGLSQTLCRPQLMSSGQSSSVSHSSPSTTSNKHVIGTIVHSLLH